MYGLVNKAVQDLITSKFGEDKWEQIKRKAGVDVDTFVTMQSYPDALTYDLVGAASAILGRDPDWLLTALGEHWMQYSAQEGYGEMLTMAGNSLVEFLANLDNLHARVGLSFPELRPPSFKCTDITDSSLRLRYYSDRPGLAPFVIGLVRGLGKRFDTHVDISQLSSRGDSADYDEFLIRYQLPG